MSQRIIDAAIEFVGAAKGYIQAFDAEYKVQVRASEAGVWGAAVQRRDRVIVEDVSGSESLTEQPALEGY